MIYGVIFFILSPFIGRLADKIHPAYLILTGTIILTINMLFFAFTVHFPGLWPVIVFMVLFGFGFSFFMSPSISLALNNVPEKFHGSASSLLRMFMNLGLVFGVAIFQTFFSLGFPKNEGLAQLEGVLNSEHISFFYRGFEISYLFAGLVGILITILTFIMILNINKLNTGKCDVKEYIL
jgi:MFS family permease